MSRLQMVWSVNMEDQVPNKEWVLDKEGPGPNLAIQGSKCSQYLFSCSIPSTHFQIM